MGFTQTTLPPIFQKIIQAIEQNGGNMTTQEFYKLLYYIRITDKDQQDITRWLKQEGYIEIQKTYQKQTIKLIKPL